MVLLRMRHFLRIVTSFPYETNRRLGGERLKSTLRAKLRCLWWNGQEVSQLVSVEG